MKKLSTIQSDNREFKAHWVMDIKDSLEKEDEEFDETPVCIYTVPKALMASNQECYQPQHVPIGFYHCFRQEMFETKRYKLAATRRMLQVHLSNNIKIEDVVKRIRELESRIRACFHKYINLSDEDLAWVMVVDACFLLEFLRNCVPPPPGDVRTLAEPSNTFARDIVRGKLEKKTITRDIMKLENQIPLFVLGEMLKIECGLVNIAGTKLYTLLTAFLEQLSPFRDIEILSEEEAITSTHILGCLYRLVLPKEINRIPDESKESRRNNKEEEKQKEKQGSKSPGLFRPEYLDGLKRLNHGPGRVVKIIVTSIFRGVVFIIKLPLTIISSIPGLNFLTDPCTEALKDDDKGRRRSRTEDEDDDIAPLGKEIEFPSASELSEASVNFVPVPKCGMSAIKFDVTSRTMHLPVVYLDENSETIMKNLVAYEQCHATGPVTFTRFTELMNGIIDSEEDVRILREDGIIVNRMKSDKDVVNLWNGMSRSVRLSKSKMLDDVIEDVNNYYNNRWNIRLSKYMMKYILRSWQLLAFVACVLLLFFMGLQAVCSIYDCQSLF